MTNACEFCGKQTRAQKPFSWDEGCPLYTHPKRLANHAMSCTGTTPRRGRIDRLAHRPRDTNPPKRRSQAARESNPPDSEPEPERALEIPPAVVVLDPSVAPAPIDSFLATLRTYRGKIDRAIAALEDL